MSDITPLTVYVSSLAWLPLISTLALGALARGERVRELDKDGVNESAVIKSKPWFLRSQSWGTAAAVVTVLAFLVGVVTFLGREVGVLTDAATAATVSAVTSEPIAGGDTSTPETTEVATTGPATSDVAMTATPLATIAQVPVTTLKQKSTLAVTTTAASTPAVSTPIATAPSATTPALTAPAATTPLVTNIQPGSNAGNKCVVSNGLVTLTWNLQLYFQQPPHLADTYSLSYRRSGTASYKGEQFITVAADRASPMPTLLRTFSFPAELGETATSVYPLDIWVVSQNSSNELTKPITINCPK